MSCCTLRCASWWACGVILNVMSVAGIVVTLSRIWPLSLALSICYSSLLFLSIRRFEANCITEEDLSANEAEHDPGAEQGTNDETEEESAEPPNAVDDDVDGIVIDDPTVQPKTTPVALSLLYLLFILSLALPGSVLVGNVVPCSDVYYTSDFNPRLATWHTNTSALPQAVREWESKNSNYKPYDLYANADPSVMFAHIEEDSLYIRGALDRPPVPHLVVISGGEPPRKVGDFKNPQWVTAVANEHVCFVTTDGDDPNCWWDDGIKSLWCGTEGNGFNKVVLNRGVTPVNLVGIDGLLWLQQTYSNEGSYSDDFSDSISDESSGDDKSGPISPTQIEGANGYAIVSVEPESMNTTIHSSLEEALDSQLPTANHACTFDTFSGLAAVCLLLLAALPMTILSGWAWIKKGIPSSAVGLFLSLGLLLISAFSIGDDFMASFALSLWLMIAAPFWLFGCSFLLVVNARVSQGPLWWSVYFLSILAFCVTIIALVEVDYVILFELPFDDDGELYGTAFFSILVVLLPLTLNGILLGSSLIFSLGALGILVEFTTLTGITLKDQPVVAAVVVLVEVVILSVAAILVYRRRNFLRDRMVMCLTRCTRRLCGETATAQDDKQATDSLLGGDEESSEGEDQGEIL